MTSVHLTERALAALDEIERTTIRRWGAAVASEYLTDLGAALGRLQDNPGLLRERPEFPGRLRFYTVREHLLVCDVLADRVFVLAVWHGAMDLVSRLERLEPQLALEAELLAQQIERSDDP